MIIFLLYTNDVSVKEIDIINVIFALVTIMDLIKEESKSFELFNRERIVFSMKWFFLVTLLFVSVYTGTNHYNATRLNHHRLYFQWELQIPLIPVFIYVYISSFVSFLVPLIVLNKQDINLLGKRYIFVIILSGIIFVLYPTQLGYPRLISHEKLRHIFSLLYFIDKPYNLFPSLHISFSATTVFSVFFIENKKIKWFMGCWLVLLTISVIAVHQHHIADIIGGYIVSFLAYGLIKENNLPFLGGFMSLRSENRNI